MSESADHINRNIAGLTVRIDRETCIGSGNCVKVAPEVFELDDGSIVTFCRDVVEIDRDRLVEACDVCPVDALHVHDEKGRRLVPRA
ncbi:MAG: ferredoxin [Phycisphaeraceae bacterium]